MGSQEFIVLYTHQKAKKSKVWQDGTLKMAHRGNKAILYDDKGERLESLFLTRLEVKAGDSLESERYLITVEEARAAGSAAVSQEDIQEARGPHPPRSMPCGRSLGCQPAGLKRKFTGFQGPRQVPKRMVIMENGESAAPLEAAAPGPALLAPFPSTPPLFAAAGREGVSSAPADLRNIVVRKDGRSGPPGSPVGSAPSSRSNPERLREEGHLCSPVSSAVKAAISFLPDEPTKGHRWAPRCLGVTQNIRSKAQILALLKSTPASVSEDVDAEMSAHVPRAQPQGSLHIPTTPQCFAEQGACAAGRTERLQCRRPPESTGSRDSRWAVYLSPQPSPAHSSAAAGDELEREPQAEGDHLSLNLRDFLEQKRIQLFETGAETVEKFNGDKLVDNADSSWDREVKSEIPPFGESVAVTCGSLGKDGLVSGSDTQGTLPVPVNQNDQVCVRRSVLPAENAQETDTWGTPERPCKQAVSHLPASERLQFESSLSDNSQISEAVTDTFSRTNTDSESLSIHGPVSHVTQPVLEVNFNLNNFETSDTEEEPQESNKMSQDPDDWEREALADACSSGVQRRCEGVPCEEGGGAPLPFLTPVGGKPCPSPETLLPQLCGAAAPTGDEAAGCSARTVGWTDDVDAGKEAANSPTLKVRSDCDFASLPDKSKGINSNLYIPHFLDIDTNQTPESNLFSEQTPPRPFFMGCDLDTNEQVLPSTSGSDDSNQRLDASRSHFDERIALDKSTPQVSSSLFYPLGGKHPISRDTGAHIAESEDLGGIPGLPHDHVEVDAAGASRQSWDRPRNSPELSGLRNNISLLRSLSEHSTALEGLEMLKKKIPAFKQQAALETQPESSPEEISFKKMSEQCGVRAEEHRRASSVTAGKPLTIGVSPAGPQVPHLNQDSQLRSAPRMMKENDQVDPGGPAQSLPFFPVGSEEETVFPAVTPTQTERTTWDPQPVEFQGHQVQGSATSAVMVRGHCPPLGCSPLSRPLPLKATLGLPWGSDGKPKRAADLTGTQVSFGGDVWMLLDGCGGRGKTERDSYLRRREPSGSQVPPPAQEGSAPGPAAAFSLGSRDEAFLLEVPEGALPARPSPGMERLSSLESQHLPRLPSFSRARAALVTAPPVDAPPDGDPGPWAAARGWQLSPGSPGSPLFSLCEEPAVLPPSSGPEDQSETLLCQASMEVTPGRVSLHGMSARSKWLKYQTTFPCALPTPGQPKAGVTEDGFPAAAVGLCGGDAGERRRDAGDGPAGPTPLQRVRGQLRRQQQGAGPRDFVCGRRALSLRLESASEAEDAQEVWGASACATGVQEISVSELCFPSGREVTSAPLPRRQTRVPAVFQSPAHYKQVFTSCLVEHLNILLCGLAQRLRKALSAVDVSFYTSSLGAGGSAAGSRVPSCRHQRPAKLVMVKKEGPNKGRLFYTCDAPRADRCDFFKWLEEVAPGHVAQADSPPALVVPVYEECQLSVSSVNTARQLQERHFLIIVVHNPNPKPGSGEGRAMVVAATAGLQCRKGFDFQRKQYGKLKKFATGHPELYPEPKSKLYLRLSRKESSSAYSKDDLWVVSKTLDFELDTFIACSAFFGPSSANEVELLPLKGYFPSRWPMDTVVHALWVCNASTELTTLKNMREHFSPATLPLTQHLLAMPSSAAVSSKSVDKRRFVPPAFSNTHTHCELPGPGAALQLASAFIQAHQLNEDQAAALAQIARMVAARGPAQAGEGPPACPLPITIVHGVFGAGKSYLLAVVILFLVQLFEKSEAPAVGRARPWKVLVSSSTNVAVDRVLLGLLSLGFDKFVRVGSVRKIAKPVLPYSLHAGSENASEQLKELQALMKEDLTPMERVYVRRSIEQHKLGTNRTLLGQVRVVGATCAACPFPCMAGLRFPVVVLDESSQMTEPASLLPIARFECEKLVLVGDPKQLPPTIQGSEAAHGNGLEQTLFDRLCLMGHKPALLRTQYRCHPAIAAVADDLFYGGGLRNGVSEAQRGPLLAWLPTLCFYHVPGQEQMEGGNSFHNEAEAAFTLMLIRALVAGGIPGTMIGVITLYKAQLGKLCHLLGTVDLDRPQLAAVQVSTVDAFQGAEKEVVVLSCVRTRQVGFIDSEQRVNVALTRGRRHLLIVGHLDCLRRSRLWGRVIQHCQGREDGLQQASQCEPRLRRLLEEHAEKLAGEKQKKASGRDGCEDASPSPGNGPV
ncbi:PREDICTED: protein ZGRF1 [Myotis davidii]|uniref:protein ZGRF1 n=1 Tax=Myotis davidii TaxID=225400 RepID=UPI000766EBC5|nr:PREDICTED: protein ZGRF1 [Myotis davidii]